MQHFRQTRLMSTGAKGHSFVCSSNGAIVSGTVFVHGYLRPRHWRSPHWVAWCGGDSGEPL